MSVGVSPDGTKVFVTGVSVAFGGSSSEDYATFAYDAATGAVLWGKFYNGGWFDIAFALTVNPDGGTVYVTGASQTSKDSSATDYATIAYDAFSGAISWVARYDGPGSGGDAAYAIAVSPDGASLFVTGESVDSSTDYATVAYSTE
jgi:DNA-binding beta-propeller fold protein YncE